MIAQIEMRNLKHAYLIKAANQLGGIKLDTERYVTFYFWEMPGLPVIIYKDDGFAACERNNEAAKLLGFIWVCRMMNNYQNIEAMQRKRRGR